MPLLAACLAAACDGTTRPPDGGLDAPRLDASAPSETPAASDHPAPQPFERVVGALTVRGFPLRAELSRAGAVVLRSPAARPFVEVGSLVRKGTVLCIIEAFKLMNEIESEVEGTVVEVLVENNHAVQYGDALFKLRKG